MDKINRLLDVIDNPERYLDNEIEAILTDPEVKEVYDILNKTKSSIQQYTVPDVDLEWKKFELSHRPHRFKLLAFFPRNIAAGIIIATASIAAVAAMVGVGVNHFSNDAQSSVKEITTDYIEPASAEDEDTVSTSEMTAMMVPQMIIFDNETLESIVEKIAPYYGCNVVFNNDNIRSLRLYFRWDQSLPVEDIMESLNNFEQIQISTDNQTIKID